MKKYIQELQNIHKNMPWDQFVIEYVPWAPMGYYKNDGHISRFPDSPRSPKLLSNADYEIARESFLDNRVSYKPEISFFENFKLLQDITPMPATIQQNSSENTQYADMVIESKNAYLSSIVVAGEDVYYSFSSVVGCKNIFSCVKVRRSENIYHSFSIDDSQNIFYSRYINSCSDIYLSTNLIGCQHCIMCDDLENQSYRINNEQYTKQEFEQKKSELLANKDIFETYYEKLTGEARNIESDDCEGSLLLSCENCHNANWTNFVQNAKNVMSGGLGQDFYNCFDFGVDSHDIYGAVYAGTGSNHIYNSTLIENSSQVFYSMNCHSSHHLFGCIGLKNKSYCILNVQYSKDEWSEKVMQICESMKDDGNFGKFFPAEMNPFFYNTTFASYMTDYNREQIEALGYMYEDETHQKLTEAHQSDLYRFYNDAGKIQESILEEVLIDKAGKSYTIIRPELNFLNRFSLPIPTKHWQTRMREHMKSIQGYGS